jgi:hypothetical protein
MAAQETFEWFVATMMKEPGPDIKQKVKEARAVLLSLRSEDERQRFVDETIQRLRGR